MPSERIIRTTSTPKGAARPTPTISRRFALKLIGGAALALPVGLSLRDDAAAGRTRCRRDSVIELRNAQGTKGNTAAIYLSAFAEEYELNSSSCDVVIEHPRDARTSKLWEDPNGYFGQGLSTNFSVNSKLRVTATGMDVRVRLYVPASRSSMQIKLEWAPGPIQWDANHDPLPAKVTASATGTANKWITLQSTLPFAK
jgi:hypothetical protein